MIITFSLLILTQLSALDNENKGFFYTCKKNKTCMIISQIVALLFLTKERFLKSFPPSISILKFKPLLGPQYLPGIIVCKI